MLRAKGPTQAELDGARTDILTAKIRGLQRLGGFGGVADMMDRYNQYPGDPGYLPKDIARFQAVTTASVRAIGQQEFGQNQRVVVFAVPGKKVIEDVPRSPADTDANVTVTPPHSRSSRPPRAGAKIRRNRAGSGIASAGAKDLRIAERDEGLPGGRPLPASHQRNFG